jgi:hypothetical protein
MQFACVAVPADIELQFDLLDSDIYDTIARADLSQLNIISRIFHHDCPRVAVSRLHTSYLTSHHFVNLRRQHSAACEAIAFTISLTQITPVEHIQPAG